MLRCFLAVAERGNLTDAARHLGRTPSAVSMMLKQFEDHIGAPLFESGRKSHLTRLGALIRVEASREVAHFQSTVAAIEGLSRAETGFVRLAATPSVAHTLMPAVIQRFAQAHPGVRLDIRDADSTTIGQHLMARRVDIGLATLPPVPGFERHLLFSDRFGVVCARDHPLTRDWQDKTWDDLASIPFIANGLCRMIEDPDFQPILNGARISVANTASMLALVRAGTGVTLLPERAVRADEPGLAFLPLRDTRIRRTIWAVHPEPRDMTPATQALARAIRAGAATLEESALQPN
ncbi:MAG: LysR family transcriptional regulator [Pseudomonadota bacterium]